MRIVHLIDELKMGGAQTHLVTMLRYLRHHKSHHHHVISLFGSGPLEDALTAIDVEVTVMDLRPNLSKKRFARAVNQITDELRLLQPDLVEAHLTWSRLLGLLAARWAGVPQRVGFEQGDIYLNSVKFRVANYVSQFYTDYFIVCSHALAAWVNQTHGIHTPNLRVLHNCVDTTAFHSGVVAAHDVMSIREPGQTVFVMIGTLGRGVNKRVDVGLRAASSAIRQGANLALIVAGDGDQRSQLESLANDLAIRDKVHFLGMRSDIPQVLAACDVFCHSAPFEPFGIVVIEAMAMGLPVIVPDQWGPPEIVDEGHTGFIYSVLDESKLAEQMVELCHDNGLRQQMGQSARRVALERFTVDSYIDELYSKYESVYRSI